VAQLGLAEGADRHGSKQRRQQLLLFLSAEDADRRDFKQRRQQLLPLLLHLLQYSPQLDNNNRRDPLL
jgi:hypothetical protein